MLPEYNIKKREKIDKIGDVVDNILNIKSIKSGSDANIKDIISIWRDVVGEKVSLVARPVSIDNEILRVAVKSAVWRQELMYMNKKIIDEINRKLSKEYVKKIILQ